MTHPAPTGDPVAEALRLANEVAQFASIGADKETDLMLTALESHLRSALAPRVALTEQWQPIETAPKDGTFLVYMPGERAKFQVAKFHPRVNVIGNAFAFDLTAPTHWMPLPEAPGIPTPPAGIGTGSATP